MNFKNSNKPTLLGGGYGSSLVFKFLEIKENIRLLFLNRPAVKWVI